MGIPKNLRKNSEKHTSLNKEEGGTTQNAQETMTQWAKWITKQFQIPPENEQPEILHISEQTWNKIHKQQNEQKTTQEKNAPPNTPQEQQGKKQ